jgi:hypothetical protein
MQQRHLWSAAKLAVRAYARDPSERNAAEVQQAWQRIRQSESLAIWKGMKPRRQDRDALFPYAKTMNGQARQETDAQHE